MGDRTDRLTHAALTEYWKHSSDMTYVKDVEGRYISVSESFAAAIGHACPADIIGKTAYEIYSDPMLAKRYIEDDARVYANGTSIENYVEAYTEKDGKPRYCVTSKYVLRDPAGQVMGLFGVSHDITREYDAHQRYENELQGLLTLPPDAMYAVVIDVTLWRIVDTRSCPAYEELTKNHLSVAECLHSSADTVVEDEVARAFYLGATKEYFEAQYESGKRNTSLEYLRRMPDGGSCWVRAELHMLLDPVNEHLSLIAVLLNIEASKRAYSELLFAAERDTMTGLFNRSAVIRQIEDFLAGEGAGGQHALFMIDLDNFKQVNDTFGHQCGDSVLEDAAKAIRMSFRATDLIGRMGGDEFMVLMKHAESEQSVCRKAEELIQALQFSSRSHKLELELTASVGLTLFTAGDSTLDTLYNEADTALYRSKGEGKNRYSLYRRKCADRRRNAAEPEKESVDTIHLRTLMENIDGGVILMESDGRDVRATYVSPSVFRTFGRSPDEILPTGEGFFSVVLDEDVQGLKKALIETAESSALLDYSYRVTGRNGTEWRHIRAKRLPESTGTAQRIICVVTDITFIKRTEEDLLEAELRYRNAIEQTNALLWEVDIPKRTLKLIGTEWERYGKGHVFKNVPESYLPVSPIHPRSVAEFKRMFTDIYRGNAGGKYYLKLQEGPDSWIWNCASFKLLADKDGTPRSALGILSAVPAIDAEMRHFDQELLFADIVRDSLLGCVRANLTADRLESAAVDGDLRYDTFFGLSYTDYYTTVCERFVSSDDSAKLSHLIARNALLERFGAGKTWAVADYRRIGVDGFQRWTSLFIKLMRHPISGDVFCFGYLRDNEARKRFENALRVPLQRGDEQLLYSPESMRQLASSVQKNGPKDSLAAVSVIELVGLERIRNEDGASAARELLFTFGRLCRIAIRGVVFVGQLDENRIVILRADAGSVERQHQRLKNEIALLRELLRQSNPEADIALPGGYAAGCGEGAVYDRLLQQASIACNSATKMLGESIAAYVETGLESLEEGAEADLAKRHEALEIRFQQQANMLRMNEYDSLTGILCKQAFYRRARELIDADPETKRMIVRFDINRFKVYNDVHGTVAGDRLLRDLAVCLRNTVGPDTLCARFESDHFVLLTPDDPAAINRSKDAFTKWFEEYSPDFKLSGTIAIYRIVDPTVDVSKMCDRALLALRWGKSSFETRLIFYDEALRSRLLEEQRLVDDTRVALETNQFLVYFQPQVNYENGALIGAEALVRWNHPVRGLLAPGAFIPLLERNGLITKLDEHIWDKTCSIIRTWRSQFSPDEVPPISVNVSRLDIYDSRLCQRLLNTLKKYALPVSALHLEITESVYMENPQQLMDTVLELRAAGFSVEMDDFGSGYSSLNSLKDVVVDVLKLDMKFLANCTDSARGGNILSSVIRMAHWLKIPVIAEGVETRDQADYLKSLNCVYMQGYYFARPMPEEVFAKLLGTQKIGKTDRYSYVNLEGVAAFWDASAQTDLIFNSFVGGAAIIEYENGRVSTIRANDRFYSEINTTREAYLDKQPYTLDRFDAKNAITYVNMLEEAARTGDEAEADIESLPQTAGGDQFWTHNRVRLLARNGDTLLYYLAIENITARKTLEQEREADEERTNLLMESTGMAFFEYDIAGDSFSYRAYSQGRGRTRIVVPQFYVAMCEGKYLDSESTEIIRKLIESIGAPPFGGEFESRTVVFSTTLHWCRVRYVGIIDAEGRIYRVVGQIADIHQSKEREAITASVRQRLNADSSTLVFNDAVVNEIFGLFYDTENIAGAIETTLALLGETFDLSRAYVFEESADRMSMSNTFEWCAEGVKPLIFEQSNIHYDEVGGRQAYLGVFEANGAFNCSDIRNMPPARRTFVGPQGVQSLLQCAIRDNGVYAGMIGFDECRENRLWTDEQIGTLLFVSRIIGSFLVKLRRADSAAFSSDFRAALDDNAAFLYIVDPLTLKVIYCNTAITAYSGGVDYSGKSCYREFAGRSEQCINCPIKGMGKSSGPSIAEITRADGMIVLAQASPLRWNGRNMVMLSCVDVTKSKQAEQALVTEKQRTELALAATNLIMWTYDIARDVFLVPKDNAERHCMREYVEGSYKTVLADGCVMEDSTEDYIALHEHMKNGEQTASAIIHMNPKNMPAEWMKITYTAVAGGDAAIVVAMDVAAQKHAEARYQQEANFRKTLGRDYILALRVNLTKDVVEDVQSAERLRPEALNGVGRESIVPLFAKMIPDLVERARFLEFFSREYLLNAIQRGETELHYPYNGLSAEGDRRFLTVDVRLTKHPGDGDAIAFFSVRDQSAELLLKRIMNKLIDTGFDYVAYIDAETGHFRLFAANADKETSLPSHGKDFAAAVADVLRRDAAEEDVRRVMDEIALSRVLFALEKKSEYVCTYRSSVKTGSRMRRLVFRTLGPDVKQLILTRQDVTELMREEHENSEQLAAALTKAKDANAAKGEFLTQISHSIRTPLNTVISLAALALEQTDVSAEVTEYLRMINSSGRVLQGLISDILDMSKIEQRIVELHPERYEGDEFRDALLATFQPLCDEKRISLTIERLNDDSPPILADRARFNQIFFNILSNAVHFTPEGGSVRFAVENSVTENGVLSCDYVISDTGCGIDKDFLPHVFEPFARENRVMEEEFSGSGLGLVIAKSLIDRMGGTVDITSEPDQGTRVCVHLEFPVDQTVRKGERPRQANELPRLDGVNVLVAEDVPINTKIITKILQHAGAVPVCAVNGEEAVRLFEESAPYGFDVILMDIFMPVMDGIEAVERIRMLDATVPIIALSAKAFAEDERLSKEVGMDAHLTKPVDRALLIRTIAALVGKN